MAYSKKQSYRRKHVKKIRKHKKSTKRGGCGCDNNKSFFSGGSNALGASPGLDQLPIRSYYDYNMHGGNDPSSPHQIISTRIEPNIISGGRRRKLSRRQKKLMKGGGFLDGWSILGNDPISNFATFPGAFNSDALLRGNFGANPNPSVQPITNIFNANNPQKI